MAGDACAAEGAYDLHSHSVFSDGSCTVDELIGQARAAGLAGLAITDHDGLSQLSYVRERSRELDFPVLAGTEVSAWNPETGRKVHVLVFGLEATSDGSGPLERIVARTLAARTANTLWQAWTLMRVGVEFEGRAVTPDAVCRVAGESTGVYKQHIMQALCDRPYADCDYQACYKRLFKNGGIAQRDISYPVAVDVVRAAREQGGVPVLAHPGQMDSWSAVPDLVCAGLCGIEVHHPDHDKFDVSHAFELAVRYDLLVTGGSDFHGRYGAPNALGCSCIAARETAGAVEELFAAEAVLA